MPRRIKEASESKTLSLMRGLQELHELYIQRMRAFATEIAADEWLGGSVEADNYAVPLPIFKDVRALVDLASTLTREASHVLAIYATTGEYKRVNLAEMLTDWSLRGFGADFEGFAEIQGESPPFTPPPARISLDPEAFNGEMYEVQCAGFYFHVSPSGDHWIIDGRDRDGLPDTAYDEARHLFERYMKTWEYSSIGAAIHAVRLAVGFHMEHIAEMSDGESPDEG